MAQTVKEYLLEKGVSKALALEMDDIAIALHNRTTKLKKDGAEKRHLLIEFGKYRHIEQRNPRDLMQLFRVTLELTQLAVNFQDRITLLGHYNIMKLNAKTGEYQFTPFGRQFFEAAQ